MSHSEGKRQIDLELCPVDFNVYPMLPSLYQQFLFQMLWHVTCPSVIQLFDL